MNKRLNMLIKIVCVGVFIAVAVIVVRLAIREYVRHYLVTNVGDFQY